jgi:hypothetical protein
MNKKKSPRVLLTLDDRVISAKWFSYVWSSHSEGTRALCEDGSSEFYLDIAHPTHKQFYGVEVSNDAPYADKKQAIREATGWDFDEEFQWLKTDAEGNAIPETDTLQTITDWLNAEIDLDKLEYWGQRTMSQYAPGFSFMSALSSSEIEALRLREADLGGPASSVPCVSTSATVEELNRVIAQRGLPFLFVDADGAEEGDPSGLVEELLLKLKISAWDGRVIDGFPADTQLSEGQSVELVSQSSFNGLTYNIYSVSEENNFDEFIYMKQNEGRVVVESGGPWSTLAEAESALAPELSTRMRLIWRRL